MLILFEILLLIAVSPIILSFGFLLYISVSDAIHNIKLFSIHKKECKETKLVLSDFVLQHITKCNFSIIPLLENAHTKACSKNNIDHISSEIGDVHLEYYIDRVEYYELMVKINYNGIIIPKKFAVQKNDNRIVAIKRNQKLKKLDI